MPSKARILALTTWAGCVALVPLVGFASIAEPVHQAVLPEWLETDCLLPGQMRYSGRMAFLGPSTVKWMTVRDCILRGGEFVASDRTRPKEATEAYKRLAKADVKDAESRYRLGQLYEGGIGMNPDYSAAAKWYAEAAALGYRDAMLALSNLYHKGLGVPKDEVRALNLYQKGSGIEGDGLIRVSEANARVDTERAKLADLEQTIRKLRTQADESVRQLRSAQNAARAAESRLQELQSQQREAVEKRNTESELQNLRAKIQMLESQSLDQQQATAQAERQLAKYRSSIVAPRMDGAVRQPTEWGQYHALVIGAQNYQEHPSLATPINDAEAVAKLLRERYAFQTDVLIDPTYDQMLGAMARVLQRASERDNVLVYFAGHGQREAGDRDRSTWLPVDFSRAQDLSLSTEIVAKMISSATARAVLVIADTCFGSALTDEATLHRAPYIWSPDSPRTFREARARLAIEAGGDFPIKDDGGRGHSIFTEALIEALEDNGNILSAFGLFKEVSRLVVLRSSELGERQTPTFNIVRDGRRYEPGEFFFVPAS